MKLLLTAKESNSVELSCDQPPALCWLSCQPFRIHHGARANSLGQNSLCHGKTAIVVAFQIAALDAASFGVCLIFTKGLGVNSQQRSAEPLRMHTIAQALAHQHQRVLLIQLVSGHASSGNQWAMRFVSISSAVRVFVVAARGKGVLAIELRNGPSRCRRPVFVCDMRLFLGIAGNDSDLLLFAHIVHRLAERLSDGRIHHFFRMPLLSSVKYSPKPSFARAR